MSEQDPLHVVDSRTLPSCCWVGAPILEEEEGPSEARAVETALARQTNMKRVASITNVALVRQLRRNASPIPLVLSSSTQRRGERALSRKSSGSAQVAFSSSVPPDPPSTSKSAHMSTRGLPKESTRSPPRHKGAIIVLTLETMYPSAARVTPPAT